MHVVIFIVYREGFEFLSWYSDIYLDDRFRYAI